MCVFLSTGCTPSQYSYSSLTRAVTRRTGFAELPRRRENMPGIVIVVAAAERQVIFEEIEETDVARNRQSMRLHDYRIDRKLSVWMNMI